MQCNEPDSFRWHNTDGEIELVDFFLIVWQRKWIIVALTLLVTAAAAGVTFVLPEVYAVKGMLEPGKNSYGNLIENPQAIQANIINGAYDSVVAETLGLAIDEIPDFKVSIPKNTNLVIISVESSEPEQAVLVVEEVIKNVVIDMQSKLDIEIETTKNKMTEVQLEDASLSEQIKLIDKQIAQIESEVDGLEKGKKEAIANPHGDAMAVLLYSNEINNQQIYLNELQEKLEALKSSKKNKAIKIDNIRLELEGMKGAKIKKKPVVPAKPIKPKKAVIIALAFSFGLAGSIVFVFIAEFMNMIRRQREEVEGRLKT